MIDHAALAVALGLVTVACNDNEGKGSAVAAGNTGICLPKCLKRLCLLSFGEDNAGISDLNF